jgi:hypothetical protein
MAQSVQLRGSGSNADVVAQVDPTFEAQRTSLRPIEYTDKNGITGGHYSIAGQTGLMAAGIADAAQVFQTRWVSAKFFILKRLVLQFATVTGFASGIGCPIQLWAAHNATASGTGGAALAPSGTNKMRASMATSDFTVGGGDIRLATTAALAASAGQQLENAALKGCAGAPNITLVQGPPITLFDIAAGDHPIVQVAGDVLALLTKTPAATGTWTMFLSMDWAEVTSY